MFASSSNQERDQCRRVEGREIGDAFGVTAGVPVLGVERRGDRLEGADKHIALLVEAGGVGAIVDATEALEADPAPYWQQVSDVIGYPVADIEASWDENEFPMYIVPDMLDVLEKEEIWVAKERDRVPRTRDELAQFIDYSVLEESMSSR